MNIAGQGRAPAAPGFVLACSPRRGGNCDEAARIMGQEVIYLREKRISPCRGCHACAGGLECPIEDDAGELLQRLSTAQSVCLVAPIYFYHLPGMLKCLIDRAQAYYERGGPPNLEARGVAYTVLIAGRAKGERLFDGSLLTLQYFWQALRVNLLKPLLLRGVDEAGALRARPDLHSALLSYAGTGQA